MTRVVPFMPTLSDEPEEWCHLAEQREVDTGGDGKTHAVVGGCYLDMAASLVCQAAGMDGYTSGLNWRPMLGWLNDGFDLHVQILPLIKDIAKRSSYKVPCSLAYFDGAIRKQKVA